MQQRQSNPMLDRSGFDFLEELTGIRPRVFDPHAFGPATGTRVGQGRASVDTAAFQRAVDEAGESRSGVVALRGGTTYVLDNVAWKANVAIVGHGPGTVLRQGSASGYVISANAGSGGTPDPSDNIVGLYLGNLTIEGLSRSLGFAEHVHLLNLNAVSDVLIENVVLRAARGDAIYLGSSNVARTERHNERVTIRHFVIDGVNKAGRNGISIIDGTDVLIEDGTLTRTSGKRMPGAIDIEPNAGGFSRIRNVTLRRLRIDDCGGNVAAVNLFLPRAQSAMRTPARNIVIDDVTVTNAPAYAIALQQVEEKSARSVPNVIRVSGIHARNCERPFGVFGVKDVILARSDFTDCNTHGVIGYTARTNRPASVQLDDVTLTRCGRTSSAGLAIYSVDGLDLRRVRLVDCGRADGASGVGIQFKRGASSHVSLDDVEISSPTGKTKRGIERERAHTFTPATNRMRALKLTGVRGNDFVPP